VCAKISTLLILLDYMNLIICGYFRMFPESLYFLEKKSIIIEAAFPSKYPSLQLCISASDCQGFENISGGHFLEAFSALSLYS